MGIFNLFGKKEKQALKGYFSLQISNVEKLNSQAVRVEFEVPSALESKFKFEPGQYVNLVLHIEGIEQRRSYSICSHPNQPLSIAIKRVENGIVSNWFNDLTDHKDPILVSAPTGNFVLPQKAKSFVAIAAGSGITPMMSLLKSNAQEIEATLIYGNKTKDEALFLSLIHI